MIHIKCLHRNIIVTSIQLPIIKTHTWNFNKPIESCHPDKIYKDYQCVVCKIMLLESNFSETAKNHKRTNYTHYLEYGQILTCNEYMMREVLT